jgi:hypothetical protein
MRKNCTLASIRLMILSSRSDEKQRLNCFPENAWRVRPGNEAIKKNKIVLKSVGRFRLKRLLLAAPNQAYQHRFADFAERLYASVKFKVSP